MSGETPQRTLGRQIQAASLVRLSSTWRAVCLAASAVCLGRIQHFIRPEVHRAITQPQTGNPVTEETLLCEETDLYLGS